ncbi:MAG: PQQ-binding-like beta-propeller repeat protein [Anaerolineales bacterium]|nr:PQQ-binding-like beta-propeller repeat protein [Anaerolineales bacterium]
MDRYLIQGVLGIGGMGAVYRARDLHFPNVTKLVAVKEMVNRALDPVVRNTIVRNFEREANLLASLDHRAIPRIYDYFSFNERSYLVEEYINGHDLEAIINNTSDFIAEERVIRWAIELCEVLDYLHSHKPEPIIFRDMKPSNIMINVHDHIVLVDFGIAKHFQAGQKGTMIGTEGYSPPEQYRGEATPLADIYSLGATLHHVLTRRDPRLEPPFSFNERPIRQINPNVSPILEAVINTTLHYNPDDRYKSAKDMKEALLGVARETGVLAQVSMPAQMISKSVEGIRPLWEFECEDEIRGSPTYHKGAIYVGCYDNNLYCLDAETGEFRWKYPTEGGIVSKPSIYEDTVIFGSEDHRLHAVSMRTGRVSWTYYTNGPVRSSPFIAEGHIFIGSDDGNLHAVNASTGRQAWRVDCGSPVRSTPVVNNDMVYMGTEAGDFYCLDYSGAVKWHFKAKRSVTSSPAIAKGAIYFGSVDSILYALDAKTGWVIWRIRLSKPTISSPCLDQNLLFTGDIDGAIYCFDVSSSREIWRYNTQHQVTGSPAIHKDSLYCGSVDGRFYCLEYRTGRLRWKFETEGPITGTPVAHEDTIYIGSTDHHLYALLA